MKLTSLRIALLLSFAVLPGLVWANCTVSSTGVKFGSYDVFAVHDLESVGSVLVDCDLDTAYSIHLDPGNGTYAMRKLADTNGNTLDYNLYVDANRNFVWGDGGGDSQIVTGTASSSQDSESVYGRIPAGQNARVGDYADTIVITVEF